jgi:hypothetical protein
MCNVFTMLVEQSDWRYVAQCEHKTVHLRWDHLTISLPPQSFLALARQIIQNVRGERPLARTVVSAATPQTPLRLRLNTVALEFTATDLPALLELVQAATQRLTPSAPATPTPRYPTPLTHQPDFRPQHFTLTQHLN